MAKFLLIEEDCNHIFLVSRALEKAGHSVKAVRSPQEALAEVSYFAPNIVLMEILLQTTDGIALATEIQRYYPEIPIWALTAIAEWEIEPAWDKKFTGFIHKPFPAQTLHRIFASL